jgi:ubiquinone/menaquinone biosynthesis C-methylase UbiE
MSLQRDPERNEINYLRNYADLSGRRVLEVGSGEGRLTWQYAKRAGTIIAIDTDVDSLRVAKVDRPHEIENEVHLSSASSEYLPFSKETFDLAILAWSL